MRTRKTIALGAVAAGLLCLSPVALEAHHAHQVVANYESLVAVTGVVVKYQFINPHTLLTVSAKNPDGTTEEWVGYGSSPTQEARLGNNGNMFKVGEERITMYGFPNKDGRKVMIWVRKVRQNGEDVPIYQTELNDYEDFLKNHKAATFKQLDEKYKRYIGGPAIQANSDK